MTILKCLNSIVQRKMQRKLFSHSTIDGSMVSLFMLNYLQSQTSKRLVAVNMTWGKPLLKYSSSPLFYHILSLEWSQNIKKGSLKLINNITWVCWFLVNVKLSIHIMCICLRVFHLYLIPFTHTLFYTQIHTYINTHVYNTHTHIYHQVNVHVEDSVTSCI